MTGKTKTLKHLDKAEEKEPRMEMEVILTRAHSYIAEFVLHIRT